MSPRTGEHVNPFVAVEAWCAHIVDRTFALAFPMRLEPVQIARKLVSVFESTALPPGEAIASIVVRTSSHDAENLAAERELLEQQWAEMLARIAVRAARIDRPRVTLEAGVGIPRGASLVAVAGVITAAKTPAAAPSFALHIRKGVPLDARFALDRSLVVGRDLACDVVLVDPRVSRRHLHITVDGGSGLRFVDLDSANGVFLNGVRQHSGELQSGDVLRLGDSELAVLPARSA